MKSDPFAPASHPSHPKNIQRGQEADADTRWLELIAVHGTDHERAWMDVCSTRVATEELERRALLVEEYRQQLAEEGPDAEAPELVDITGELYVWREGDRTEDDAEEPSGQPDGETSSGWYFVGEPQESDPAGGLAIPPRNGPGSDTETWRAFAAQATLTEPAQWATLNRTEIIATLEKDGVIPREGA